MNRQSLRIVVLLPMKAHSERVANKNFRMFNGKPLFRWILDKLLSIEAISMVVINTDARKLLADHGLQDTSRISIRDRKSEICGDFVSMNTVLADDVANVPADIYLMTHTTNPLLKSATIQNALDWFIKNKNAGKCDSLFTVNRFQSRFYRRDGTPVNHDPKNLVRTQDLEPLYEENSNLYIFTKESFRTTNARIGRRPRMFVTSYMESIDIDDKKNWQIAETLSKLKNGLKK